MAKIAIFVNVDYYFLSHRLALARGLRDAGYDIVVIAAETGRGDEIRAAGFRFVPIPLSRSGQSPAGELRTLAAVTAAYRRERPDVVQHASIKPLMYGSWIARVLGISVVNIVTGLGYAMIDRPSATVRQRVLRAGVKAGYRLAFHGRDVHNVFQNPSQRDHFVEQGLCDRDSATLVRGSGVDLARFPERPLPSGAPVVMCPARLLWDKGIAEFVEAARLVRATGSDARFVIIGGEDAGNPSTIPRAQVDAWVAEGAIEWWGHQTDMPAALAQSSVVVLPSYAEGMPLALAEGAATGRAVITTDIPGCREVVVAGATGWLVPVRNGRALATAVLDALSDPERLARWGHASRQHVEAVLAFGHVIRDMLALYRRILGARAPATPTQ